MVLFEYFLKTCDENPNKVAIWCDGEEKTYSQLKTLVCKYSNYLVARGVKKGDIIGIPMNNSVESVALMLAVSAIGAGIAPINPTIHVTDIKLAFKAANVKHLIARKAFYQEIKDTELDSLSGCKLCLDGHIDGADDWEAVNNMPDSEPDCSRITGEETFILTMTSGSTGVPKPIQLTQNNKLQRIHAHVNLYKITPDDRILAATPLYHSLAERLVLIPLMIGATSILLPRFSPAIWIECVAAQKVTFTIAVSAQLNQIVLCLSSLNCQEDISSLRALVSSSALLEQHVRDELIKKLHCDFHEMYGTSECSTVTNINFKESFYKIQSVGRPLPGVEVCILDDDGNEKPINEVGEIGVKTPLMCAGYYGLPELTDKATVNGFFKTGDLGKKDNDGYLYFMGRKKEIIITGGINVYPQDIERKLITLPAIKECAAFPYVDERLGEVVALAIVFNEGMELTKKDIRVYCARNMADFQQPHKIFFLDDLPKNSMGKLTKMKLPEVVAGMEG